MKRKSMQHSVRYEEKFRLSSLSNRMQCCSACKRTYAAWQQRMSKSMKRSLYSIRYAASAAHFLFTSVNVSAVVFLRFF